MYNYGKVCEAGKIRDNEYIPMIDGNESGKRVYFTSLDALNTAKEKAKSAYYRKYPNADPVVWVLAGKPKRKDGGWDWAAIVKWHKAAA